MDRLFDKEEEKEGELEKTPFHSFAKNTKQTCMIMCTSLFIIIVITVFNSNNIRSRLFMITAAMLLSYCFYTNMIETSILYDSVGNDVDIRKNIILSYAFSGVLFLFVIYLLYTMIF